MVHFKLSGEYSINVILVFKCLAIGNCIALVFPPSPYVI